MTFMDPEGFALANPLEIVEKMAASNDWSFERAGEEEITLLVRGKWTDYQISFTWMPELEALHLACAFEFKLQDRLAGEAAKLVASINENLWVGHFDLWQKDGLVMFRHALVLVGASATNRQCETILGMALDACERYYPAFQYVVWAGKSAQEALDAVNFETKGSA